MMHGETDDIEIEEEIMNPKHEGKNDGTMRDVEADDIEIAELSMNSKVEEKILTMDLIR